MVLVSVSPGIGMAQTKSAASDEGSGSVQQQGGQPNTQGTQGSVGGTGGAPSVRGSSGGASVRVIPSIAVSERYDSNVLFSPQPLSDYVTSIRPSARVEYRDDLVDGALTGGINSEVYVRNPGLNYVGFSSALDAKLDKLISRLVRGVGVQVVDSVMYTPQPPAFVMPEASPTSFIRGVQAARNNSLSNAGSILSTYSMTPLAQLNASYSHQMLRFLGGTSSGIGGGLFNSTVQSITAGPEYHITRNQSIGASYQYQHMAIEPSTGRGVGLVQVIHGTMVTWKATPTRELTVEVSPGVSIVTSIPEKPQWTAQALVQWGNGKTDVQLTYSRGIYPSFFLGAAALISNNVTLALSQNFSSEWRVTSQTDYALNSSVGGLGNLRFESYGETVSVNYAFSRGMVASVSGTYNHFSYSAGASEIQFPRQTAMFTLTKRWN